jgi:large subunit ribosomal protein L11
MAKLTKKQKAFEGKVDPNTHYAVDEAIGLVKSLATSKFDETVEIATTKMKDLNANDIEAATKIIEGSARAMGLQVVEG